MKNLRDWHADYNERYPDCKCPDSVLSPSCTKEELNKWLTIFISETRNQNGENYPPKTYAIVTGILRFMTLIILTFWINVILLLYDFRQHSIIRLDNFEPVGLELNRVILKRISYGVVEY